MGICVSCGRDELRAHEKPPRRRRRAKAAAADLLPRRAYVLATMANSISNIKMTNPIKGIVSKRRKRYIKDGFNLDLAYITDRLIAMGFPAEKLEGVYRNHIDEVARFLEQKHKDHYYIYNLCSERSYDSSKFHDRVKRYAFEDHCPPKIEMIQPFCEDIHNWLRADPKNVAAVHCKAGKGRTGTMVCCYLLYSGQKATAEEALNYYGTTRTHDEKGVTIPSQRRYVHYYGALLRSGLSYRTVSVHIRELTLSPSPLATLQGTLELCVTHSSAHRPLQGPSACHELRKHEPTIRMVLNHCTPLSGDVRVEVYNKGKMMRKDKLFHFWFNTFFVTHEFGAVRVPPLPDSLNLETYKLTLNKWQLDDAHKDKQHKLYHPDFKVEVIVQKLPESSKFTGAQAAHRAARAPRASRAASPAASPPHSDRSSCSDPDTDKDENWDSAVTWDQLDDTSSNQSTMTSITDIPHACAQEGKIPKVSSDHTLSSERHLYESKSPSEANKKRYMFFKRDDKESSSEVGKPRLSLGDMRASWREFSGKHFGNDKKKPNSDDSNDA